MRLPSKMIINNTVELGKTYIINAQTVSIMHDTDYVFYEVNETLNKTHVLLTFVHVLRKLVCAFQPLLKGKGCIK